MSRDEPPSPTVGLLLPQVGRRVARGLRTRLEPLDLDPRQYLLLRSVGACRDQSQHAVGSALQIPPSRVVVLVDALAARGLLERIPNPVDRRAHALRLTPAGRRLLDRARRVVAAHEEEVCAPFDGAERDLLLVLLQRLGPGSDPDGDPAPVGGRRG